MITLHCKHLLARVRATSPVGTAWCPICNETVDLVDVINNWLDTLSALHQRLLADYPPRRD